MRASSSSRKRAHLALVLGRDVGFRAKEAGFARWEFEHNALPELDWDEVDPAVTFLGRRLAAPLLISGMTGGIRESARLNAALARVCATFPIAMGVGSQRLALDDPACVPTFRAARAAAPQIPLIGNIGAAQIVGRGAVDRVRQAVAMIRADAVAVHLNPAQELVQPEGTPRFRGVARALATLVRVLEVPVIVKEVGAGLSGAVARRLAALGIRHFDVAGAGGTSWTGVELLRGGRREMQPFWDWGIPTAEAIVQVRRAAGSRAIVIGSGGIASGLDAAKAIALGADLAGAARPFLAALDRGGPAALRALLEGWIRQLRAAMFLTGSATLARLRHARLHLVTVAS